MIHIVRESSPRFTRFLSLVLIRLVLTEIQTVWHPDAVSDSVRMAMHFFVNFDIFKWLYLAYVWVYLHQTWGFCKASSALYDLCESIVANPIIYRLVPSPSRFETRQWRALCGKLRDCFTRYTDTTTLNLSRNVSKFYARQVVSDDRAAKQNFVA